MNYRTMVDQDLVYRHRKPTDEVEAVLVAQWEREGVKTPAAALRILDAREPTRPAKEVKPVPAKDPRFVSISYSPKECEVIARGIGMLLATGYAPVNARQLLNKLLAAEGKGRLLDKMNIE